MYPCDSDWGSSIKGEKLLLPPCQFHVHGHREDGAKENANPPSPSSVVLIKITPAHVVVVFKKKSKGWECQSCRRFPSDMEILIYCSSNNKRNVWERECLK